MHNYDISEKGLMFFRDNYLKLVDRDGQLYKYIYIYQGSTCRDGGAPFTSIFHVSVEAGEAGIRFDDGYIELPEDNNPGALKMCHYSNELVQRLKKPPAFCGEYIEDILKTPMNINYAGCLCHEPMVNEKWKTVLSTVHYALSISISD